MLYVYYGNDRLKSLRLAEAVLQKFPTEEVVRFEEATVEIDELMALTSEGLFGGGKAVRCDGILSTATVKEAVFDNLNLLQQSKKVFVFIEDYLSAPDLKIMEKHSSEVVECKLGTKKESFNIFSLADALGMRDKKALWVLFTRALASGKSSEEISGTLFWQLKNLLIVEAGGGKTLSPFVVSKAKRFSKNFKQGELQSLALALVTAYNEAHRGGVDLETSLERFILSV